MIDILEFCVSLLLVSRHSKSKIIHSDKHPVTGMSRVTFGLEYTRTCTRSLGFIGSLLTYVFHPAHIAEFTETQLYTLFLKIICNPFAQLSYFSFFCMFCIVLFGSGLAFRHVSNQTVLFVATTDTITSYNLTHKDTRVGSWDSTCAPV